MTPFFPVFDVDGCRAKLVSIDFTPRCSVLSYTSEMPGDQGKGRQLPHSATTSGGQAREPMFATGLHTAYARSDATGDLRLYRGVQQSDAHALGLQLLFTSRV
jgi:hypothetical protein